MTWPVNKQFEGVINAMIRVTIQPGFACCLCIICTSAPFTPIGVLVLTLDDNVPLVTMGAGCGSPEEGGSGEASGRN